MGVLTIILLLCGIASIITTILVVAVCMLSARITHQENLGEAYFIAEDDNLHSLKQSVSWSD